MGSSPAESSYFEDEVLLGLSLKSGTFRCLECKRSLVKDVSTLGISCANCQKLLNLHFTPESPSPPSATNPLGPKPSLAFLGAAVPNHSTLFSASHLPQQPAAPLPLRPHHQSPATTGDFTSTYAAAAAAMINPKLMSLFGMHPSFAAAMLMRNPHSSHSNPNLPPYPLDPTQKPPSQVPPVLNGPPPMPKLIPVPQSKSNCELIDSSGHSRMLFQVSNMPTHSCTTFHL